MALRRYTWSHDKRLINGTTYSRSQLDILSLIAEGVATTTKGLAELLFVSSGSVTQSVESLVKKRLIEKIRDTEDRRIQKLSVTEAGKEIAADYRLGLRSQIVQFMDYLSNEEVEVLLGVLDKVALIAENKKHANEVVDNE